MKHATIQRPVSLFSYHKVFVVDGTDKKCNRFNMGGKCCLLPNSRKLISPTASWLIRLVLRFSGLITECLSLIILCHCILHNVAMLITVISHFWWISVLCLWFASQYWRMIRLMIIGKNVEQGGHVSLGGTILAWLEDWSILYKTYNRQCYTEIQTDHLPNIRQKRYYFSLLRTRI